MEEKTVLEGLSPNQPKPQTGPDLDDLIFAGEGWKASDR